MSRKNRRATASSKRIVRNPVASSALLKKGGVHERSRKAERQQAKVQLRRGEHDQASGFNHTQTLCLVVFGTVSNLTRCTPLLRSTHVA